MNEREVVILLMYMICIQSFPAVTVELVSVDPGSGIVGLPDVSVPENGLDPRLCVRLTGGVTIARDVAVTLSTGTGGTAQGKAWLLFHSGKKNFVLWDSNSRWS